MRGKAIICSQTIKANPHPNPRGITLTSGVNPKGLALTVTVPHVFWGFLPLTFWKSMKTSDIMGMVTMETKQI